MAKKDRTGNRKSREQRKQFKVPELGYYLIVTDTEATERCYFTGLHQALPEDVRNKLVIKVVETKTRTMIDKCLELTAYDAQYRIPWIVFDRDQVQGFDEIVAEAVSKGIQVGWSNPCFEIWMYAYFGAMPAIQDSWCSRSKFLTKLLKTFDKTFREIFPVFISTKRREKPSAFFDNNFVNNAYFSEAASSSSSHLASSSSKAPISSRMTCLCLWSS